MRQGQTALRRPPFGGPLARRAALAFAVAAACGANTAAHAEEDTEADLVAKGRYLAELAGCGSCHTAAESDPYAGGVVLKTPFGRVATPNITPDPATGIGSWTKETFESALRRGIGDHGEPLYPTMPYRYYTKLRDSDIDALWAYFRTREPIRNAVAVNRLRFPFNMRASLRVWRALYFEPGRFRPNPDRSAAWNRGRYIAEALGHCGACHTPRNALGAPIPEKRLQGGRVEEWWAPNISGGPRSILRDWSGARLKAVLSDDDRDNRVAVGSMYDIVRHVWHAKARDMDALVTYLLNQNAAPGGGRHTGAPARAETAPKTAAAATAFPPADFTPPPGAGIYREHCRTCHGRHGRGEPGVGASFVDAGGLTSASPRTAVAVLLMGIPPRGIYGKMPSFRDKLDDREIARVVNYIRTAWGNNAPANTNAQLVAEVRAATKSRPKALKAATCANVPADQMSRKIRAALARLAKAGAPDPGAVRALYDRYTERFPEVAPAHVTQNLSAVYCQQVALSDAAPAEVGVRTVAFRAMLPAPPGHQGGPTGNPGMPFPADAGN